MFRNRHLVWTGPLTGVKCSKGCIWFTPISPVELVVQHCHLHQKWWNPNFPLVQGFADRLQIEPELQRSTDNVSVAWSTIARFKIANQGHQCIVKTKHLLVLIRFKVCWPGTIMTLSRLLVYWSCFLWFQYSSTSQGMSITCGQFSTEETLFVVANKIPDFLKYKKGELQNCKLYK